MTTCAISTDFHMDLNDMPPDNVIWASADPHRDGVWPESQPAMEEQFAGVDAG